MQVRDNVSETSDTVKEDIPVLAKKTRVCLPLRLDSRLSVRSGSYRGGLTAGRKTAVKQADD